MSQPISIKSSGFCFKWFYHMYGASVNVLNIKILNLVTSTSSIVWTRSGNQGNRWKNGQVYTNEIGNFRFILEGIVGDGREGDIAIDDIASNYGPCPGTMYCDFEQDLCGFTNYPFADFDWARQSSNELASSTGPAYDHVRFFIFILVFVDIVLVITFIFCV
jgi:hypothetical protein